MNRASWSDRFLDFLGEHVAGPMLVLLVVLVPVVLVSITVSFALEKPRDYAAECRARCTASGLVMTGVEFGSKQQCKCEVAR